MVLELSFFVVLKVNPYPKPYSFPYPKLNFYQLTLKPFCLKN
ncbi:hypothetical protein LEP1GSC188_1660 [Leptospira weilii serovar Topaz str. LT2116]|uniref:Uncharacterized protein n=1 Tax=Leptospira weilii serovar Topaz str. LT2116 TaxID=1088540 RepID=M3GS89_9LEPT|nr:hypothetical protein LEP1GSC188_1660 [Leptospira weilii serovar Topaz str. LT2116]